MKWVFLLFLILVANNMPLLSDEQKDVYSLENTFTITRKGLPIIFWIGKDQIYGQQALFSIELQKNGEWTPPIRVSALNEEILNVEQIVISRAGYITAVWNSKMDQKKKVIRAATLSTSGIWDAPTTLCH